MRTSANKNYRSFVAGLITEASPLTYPENASLDESNCVIFQKGNRTRRLGFVREDSVDLSPFTTLTSEIQQGLETEAYSWEAVNETGEVDILVVRSGNWLYFYNHRTDVLQDRKLDFELDLRTYGVNPDVDIFNSSVSFANGRGFMFVVGEHITPISLEYVPETETFIVREISIQIRDFTGVDDNLANETEPTTLSPEHHYNLRNQGWLPPSSKDFDTVLTETVTGPFGLRLELPVPPATVTSTDGPIRTYFDQFGVYPGNNKQWWVGRLEIDDPDRNLNAGDFDPEILCDTYFGNTRAPRGHYILNAFDKDRSEVSGVPGLERVTRDTRPNAVGFYSGRVWYGHESDVFYSQTLIDHRQAGNCYQDADPTSEAISDLIDTDGGLIPIPEAHNIVRLYPLGGGLLVFAENGLWFINGGGGNSFTANDISVSKISSNGILGRRTLVEADGTIYWWSAAGIMSLAQQSGVFGAQDGAFDRINISLETIQAYYNNCIPEESKDFATGIYDPIRGMVQWLFTQDIEQNPGARSLYDSILNLDTTLQAFYPWKMSRGPYGPYVCGVFERVDTRQIRTPGITTQKGPDTFNTRVKYMFFAPTWVDASEFQKPSPPIPTSMLLGFGDFSSTRFVDFLGDIPTGSGDFGNSAPSGLGAYTSFMETGYEILDDLMRDKQQNYVYLYFRRTDDEESGVGSSCFFQTRWDWSRSEISGRWSRLVQGYRITRRHKEAAVVATKHKARGHGRAIQLRFESDAIGDTFDLLGWATNYTGETVV